jgi:spore coat polysaccharide biosynthesis protein SpsF (cytidylyltransferase family)
MAEILRGLDAVVQIKDDIVVHGTEDEHEQQLEEVCKRD